MTRTKTASIAAGLAAVLLLAPGAGLVSPAEASHAGFSGWGAFRVGGIHFSIGVHDPGPRWSHGPFYRVERPLRYSGYSCGSACYLDRGVSFHHHTCPVVLHHFRTHRFAPPRFGPYRDSWGQLFFHYRPPGPAYYGHRSFYHYPDRFDARGHDRWRGGDRYDDHRGRGRGHDKHHQHDRSCGWGRGRHD